MNSYDREISEGPLVPSPQSFVLFEFMMIQHLKFTVMVNYPEIRPCLRAGGSIGWGLNSHEIENMLFPHPIEHDNDFQKLLAISKRLVTH